MTQAIFIGVDGGATKCTVRVEDEAGNVLGAATTGSANIRISVEETWASIYAALDHILKPQALFLGKPGFHFHAGMGLSGLEMEEAYQAFVNKAHDFHTLVVASDAHIACLGAHKGRDGAVMIAGTGVVGFQLEQGATAKVSGFGFPHDDIGGGAWLGLQAAQITLQWLDGRLPFSGLANAVYEHFQNDMVSFVSWINKANSTAFAQLAPLVVQQSLEADITSINLLQQAAAAIDSIARALANRQLISAQLLPCAFQGGIAPFLTPYLSSTLKSRLCPSEETPEAGAIFLIRQTLLNK